VLLRLLLIVCLLWQSLACCCGELVGTGCHSKGAASKGHLTTASLWFDASKPAWRPTSGDHPHHTHHCIGGDCWFVESKQVPARTPVRDPLPWSHTSHSSRSLATRHDPELAAASPLSSSRFAERPLRLRSNRQSPSLLERRRADLFSTCMLC
jgi:hypothetical protein